MDISLVLGGGGGLGYLYIGIIKKLKELDCNIIEMSGCSVGALVGLLYCSDPNIDLEKIVISDLNLFKLIKFSKSKLGILNQTKIEAFLQDKTKARKFEDLKIPFSFNSTDINTGKEFIFSSGEIFPAILSTIAVPGLFMPIQIGDNMLMDGGFSDNVPIKNLKNKDRIVAVNITSPRKIIDKKSNKIDVLINSMAILQNKITKEYIEDNQDLNMLYLEPNIGYYPFDINKGHAKELIKMGYNSISKELIEKIKII